MAEAWVVDADRVRRDEDEVVNHQADLDGEEAEAEWLAGWGARQGGGRARGRCHDGSGGVGHGNGATRYDWSPQGVLTERESDEGINGDGASSCLIVERSQLGIAGSRSRASLAVSTSMVRMGECLGVGGKREDPDRTYGFMIIEITRRRLSGQVPTGECSTNETPEMS